MWPGSIWTHHIACSVLFILLPPYLLGGGEGVEQPGEDVAGVDVAEQGELDEGIRAGRREQLRRVSTLSEQQGQLWGLWERNIMK